MKKLIGLTAFAVLAVSPLLIAADKPVDVVTDAKFAVMAASSDLFEIKSSELALNKSKDEHTQKMAKDMIKDHTEASVKLKKIAADKKIELPTEMDKTHQALYDNLSKAANFDKAYVEAQLAAHRQAVGLFKVQAASGKDKELQEFAAATLPVIQKHLEHFEKMSKGEKPAE